MYLIDHTWTYYIDQARNHLETIPKLADRMAALMDIPTTNRNSQEVINDVLDEMWKWVVTGQRKTD